MGSFHSFMKKDPIKNIDVRRDEKPKVDIKKDFAFMEGRVPVGTTTHIYQTNKIDQKTGILDRTNIISKELPRNGTDHVSYDPPTATRPQQRVYDLMMTQPRYSKNHQSTVHWMPYEQMVEYNKKQERMERKLRETNNKENDNSQKASSKGLNRPPRSVGASSYSRKSSNFNQ